MEQIQHLLGHTYHLERELGGGAMSRVFVAKDKSLDRRVVIKVLPPDSVQSLSAERFTREVRLAAKLQQANIVPVLSAGIVGGMPYYTMPFVSGESLRLTLSAGTPLSILRAIEILRDVGRALSFAHEHGVVHRDIKPENILLSGATAVVTDFGIAKALRDAETRVSETHATLTRTGMSVGTPHYMAPEQITGDPATDHRARYLQLRSHGVRVARRTLTVWRHGRSGGDYGASAGAAVRHWTGATGYSWIARLPHHALHGEKARVAATEHAGGARRTPVIAPRSFVPSATKARCALGSLGERWGRSLCTTRRWNLSL